MNKIKDLETQFPKL